ncbi:MAG: response regulator transcription factor [Anaerolinea sp.]|nr:response regulator transcription factor [Anaerolinea sp.]MCC6972601.1 response regulator transcription factor [Anaerolineae bacterium]
MNILYIEDEPDVVTLVSMYVNSAGHSLTVVKDTDEARRKFAFQPDLVLVDVRLRHRNEGRDFVRELRAQGYEGVVVAVTAMSSPQDVEANYEAGFTEVLLKPFTIDQLADVVARYTPA